VNSREQIRILRREDGS